MTDHTDRGSMLVPLALTAGGVILFMFESRHPAFHALPLMQPDSGSYLDGNIARSPAYPLLLRALTVAPGGFASITIVQHVAVLSAGVFMAISFAALFGRPLLAIGLATAVVGNPALVSYCFTILPEAFFIAALMVHLGCVMRFARGGAIGAAAAAGATAAVAAMFKPVGYAAVAALAVLALQHRRRFKAVAALGGAAAAVISTAAVLNYAVRGVFATQSQGGYSRAAYAAVLLDPTPTMPYPDLTKRIGDRVAPYREAVFAAADPQVAALIGANGYHAIETIVHDEVLNHIERERGTALADRSLFPKDPAAVLGLNRIGAWLAGVAVQEHPVLYARMVAVNVAALWWQPLIQSSTSVKPLQAKIDDVVARHPALGPQSFPFRILPLPAYAAVRLTLIAAIVCAIIGVVSLTSSDRRWQVLSHASVLVHGYFIGVSTSQPGLPRYAIAVWPASMLVVFGTAAMWTRFSRARER